MNENGDKGGDVLLPSVTHKYLNYMTRPSRCWLQKVMSIVNVAAYNVDGFNLT